MRGISALMRTTAVLLGLLLTAVAVPASADTVVFSDGFEGSDFSAWTRTRIDGNGSIDLVTSPVFAGAQAARFTVPADGASYRAEVAKDALGYGSYRYEFANHLPSTYDTGGPNTIVAQWHGYPLASTGNDTKPPIALSVLSGRWTLKVHELAADETTVLELRYDLGTVTFGQWHQWKFDITWSTASGGGSVTVWRDGTQVLADTGNNNYHQTKAPYFKVGIYRPAWHGGPASGPAVVEYTDSVTITHLGP